MLYEISTINAIPAITKAESARDAFRQIDQRGFRNWFNHPQGDLDYRPRGVSRFLIGTVTVASVRRVAPAPGTLFNATRCPTTSPKEVL